MKKYTLVLCLIMLSLFSTLSAQLSWDDSACIYQANRSNILLREKIDSSFIIFYNIDNQLFLEKFNDSGQALFTEPLNLDITENLTATFKIEKCEDNSFFITWREDDILNLKKVTETGSDVWNSPLTISIIDYTNQAIEESHIVEEHELIHLLVNYGGESEDNIIVHYQNELLNNTPQAISESAIYDGNNLVSLTGEMTSQGLTAMWLQPDEAKLFILRNNLIHEIDNQFGYDYGSSEQASQYKMSKIIELNSDKIIYSLLSKYFYQDQDGSSGLYIYDNSDSTFTNIALDESIIDLQKLSENEFIMATMSSDNVYFTRYNSEGTSLSTSNISHDFDLPTADYFLIHNEISGFDTVLDDDEYKLVLITRYLTTTSRYHYSVGFFNYALDSGVCSSREDELPPYEYARNSGIEVILGDSNASLLNRINCGSYSVYKHFFIPLDEEEEITHHLYKIGRNYYHLVFGIDSFNWNGNNHVMMMGELSLLEVGLNQDSEIATDMTLGPKASRTKLHKLSDDNHLFDFSTPVMNSVVEVQGINQYNDDGTIDYSVYSSSNTINCHNNSLVDFDEGTGWFAYLYSYNELREYRFLRFEENVLHSGCYTPIGTDQLLAIKDDYLIKSSNNQLKLTKLADNGEIAEGWSSEGQSLNYENEENIQDQAIFSYQDKLIFTYMTNENIKVLLIDPLNSAETITYTLPSNEGSLLNVFVEGNKLYNFIHNNNGGIFTLSCYDIANNFTEMWQRNIAESVRDDFDIKELDNRFVIAYSQGSPGTERVYVKTISFNGSMDQYEDGFVLPLHLSRQYKPVITLAENNTIFVNRIENNFLLKAGVYCDLIDLSYFVPTSSEEVVPVSLSANNYPNPFNPETTISYNLPQAGTVKVEVYNLRGQLVKTLINEEQSAGKQQIVWRGNNNRGKQVSSGVYLYKIKSEKAVLTGKMILMK